MTPSRNASWLSWLHMTAPAAFVGYGLFLVSRSVILAVVVGAGVFLLCRFLIGLSAPRSNSDDGQSDATVDGNGEPRSSERPGESG
jgi:hypothetical protein